MACVMRCRSGKCLVQGHLQTTGGPTETGGLYAWKKKIAFIGIGAFDCSIKRLCHVPRREEEDKNAGWGKGGERVEGWGKPLCPLIQNAHITDKGKMPVYTHTHGLTWAPPDRSLLAAAEAHLAKDPQEMPFTQRSGVFAGAGATFGSRHPVAVRFPRLTFLANQGAGDCSHLPD